MPKHAAVRGARLLLITYFINSELTPVRRITLAHGAVEEANLVATSSLRYSGSTGFVMLDLLPECSQPV